MTAADLKRLDELSAKTKELRAELSRLRNASEVSAVNYSGTGVGSGTGDPVSKLGDSVVDLERDIAEKQVEMSDILDTVIKYQIRKVLRLYYVHGKSCTAIAKELHYSDRTGPYRVIQRFRDSVLTKTQDIGN